MMNLRTPILSLLIGEGGSGGALAFCVSDEIAALENALLSVISPRGCASILWKDSSREQEAARVLGCLLYTSPPESKDCRKRRAVSQGACFLGI